MEIFNDWKFWGMLGQSAIMIAGFCVIKFNDLKHLTKDVAKIDEKVTCLDKKIVSMKIDVAVLQEKTKDI